MATTFNATFTNGVDTVVVNTAAEAAQLRWEGWWTVGDLEPEIPLEERFVFGPVRTPLRIEVFERDGSWRVTNIVDISNAVP